MVNILPSAEISGESSSTRDIYSRRSRSAFAGAPAACRTVRPDPQARRLFRIVDGPSGVRDPVAVTRRSEYSRLLNSCRHRGANEGCRCEGSTTVSPALSHAGSYARWTGLVFGRGADFREGPTHSQFDKEKKGGLVEQGRANWQTNKGLDLGQNWPCTPPAAPAPQRNISAGTFTRFSRPAARTAGTGREGQAEVLAAFKIGLVPCKWKFPGGKNFQAETPITISTPARSILGGHRAVRAPAVANMGEREREPQSCTSAFPPRPPRRSSMSAPGRLAPPGPMNAPIVASISANCDSEERRRRRGADGAGGLIGAPARYSRIPALLCPRPAAGGTMGRVAPRGPASNRMLALVLRSDRNAPTEVKQFLRDEYIRLIRTLAGMTEQGRPWRKLELRRMRRGPRGTIAQGRHFPTNYGTRVSGGNASRLRVPRACA